MALDIPGRSSSKQAGLNALVLFALTDHHDRVSRSPICSGGVGLVNYRFWATCSPWSSSACVGLRRPLICLLLEDEGRPVAVTAITGRHHPAGWRCSASGLIARISLSGTSLTVLQPFGSSMVQWQRGRPRRDVRCRRPSPGRRGVSHGPPLRTCPKTRQGQILDRFGSSRCLQRYFGPVMLAAGRGPAHADATSLPLQRLRGPPHSGHRRFWC